MTTTAQPAYCILADVTNRLYAGQGQAAPADAARDALVQSLIDGLSREFDGETNQPLGSYAVNYESRLYSGLGRQHLDVDEFATIVKVEYNTTPTGVPSWTDVSADFAAGRMATKPIRFWPKLQIFRQYTFVVDPYQTGNYRMTGIFGILQPDMNLAQPAAAWNGLDAPHIQALAPDPTQATGWWATPHEVSKAVADWATYEYKASQANFGQTGGSPQSGGTSKFSKSGYAIPGSVQRVIDAYRGGALKLALIGLDGSDAKEESPFTGTLDPFYRWAGWQTVP